jgi:hypothetical protein
MLRVVFNDGQRISFNQVLLETDGLGNLIEDPCVGYGAVALTGLGNQLSQNNESLKAHLAHHQSVLKSAMADIGVTLYDPASSPFSPDLDLSKQPNEVFMMDSARIAMARHITFLDIIPTTGVGIELEKARRLRKFLYVLHHPEIRTSRMQPDCALHLASSDIENDRGILTEIFAFVHEHTPCVGLNNSTPVMMGINRKTGQVVDLEQATKERWPSIIYRYDGTKRILPLLCSDTSQLDAPSVVAA